MVNELRYQWGNHYLVEKIYAKNRYGIDVPVFVYGDLPDVIDRKKLFENELLIGKNQNVIDSLQNLKKGIITN